jgi:hypothetical protein
MSFFSPKDLALEVAKGNIPGHRSANIYGRNTNIGTSEEDVWDGGGAWIAPTAPRVHQIASTSTDDDGVALGVGARTLEIFGLTTWDSTEVSEVITMRGTTNVPTANSYVIIHRMVVRQKGPTSPNVGLITATADTDLTVTAEISPDIGQTQMAVYGIPSTQTAFVTNIRADVQRVPATAFIATVKINTEPTSVLPTFVVLETVSGHTQGPRSERGYNPYIRVPGPAIFKITAAASAVNSDTSASFDIYLVDN